MNGYWSSEAAEAVKLQVESDDKIRHAKQIELLIESHDVLIAHVEDLCRKLDKLLGDA